MIKKILNHTNCLDITETEDASSLLFMFCEKYKFNKSNLNAVNLYGVTPLTVALEKEDEEVVLELLSINVNPLIENIHGNTPIYLSKNKPWFLNIINQAIELKNCKILHCELNAKFFYDNKCYIINKIIRTGSCSLVTIEIQECNTQVKYFLKIKKYFGGLEIRNYVLLNQYIDLFKVEKLILHNNHNSIAGDTQFAAYTDVYGLIQKIIPGNHLSFALNISKCIEDKKNIIQRSCMALKNLHQLGYIHNDALPDNCLWDGSTQTANFIDFDAMRNIIDFKHKKEEDLLEEYIEERQFSDFKSLLIGNQAAIKQQTVLGLIELLDNPNEAKDVISELDESIMSAKVKSKLLKNVMF